MVCGGVIPPQDYEFLYESGVTCIFGPGKDRTSGSIKDSGNVSTHPSLRANPNPAPTQTLDLTQGRVGACPETWIDPNSGAPLVRPPSSRINEVTGITGFSGKKMTGELVRLDGKIFSIAIWFLQDLLFGRHIVFPVNIVGGGGGVSRWEWHTRMKAVIDARKALWFHVDNVGPRLNLELRWRRKPGPGWQEATVPGPRGL